jgi:flagellar hook-length control protein FliK
MTFIPPDIALVRPSADSAPQGTAKSGRGGDDGFARALDRASRKHEAPESAPDRASHARENRRPERERETGECTERNATCESTARDDAEMNVDAPAEELANTDETPEAGFSLDHKSRDGDDAPVLVNGEPAAPATPTATKQEIPASLTAGAPATQATPVQGSDFQSKRDPAAIMAAGQPNRPEQAPLNAVPADAQEQAPTPPAAETTPASKTAAAEPSKDAARAAIADLVLPRRPSDSSNSREPARLSVTSSSAITSLPKSLVDFTTIMQANETVAAPASTVAATAPSSTTILAELANPGPAGQSFTADTLFQPNAVAAGSAAAVQSKTVVAAAAPREMPNAVPLADIPLRIAAAAANGVDHLRIVLEPAELGRVDVKITFDDGRISAALMVDRPETLDLLQRDSRALERALNDAGFKTDSDSLDFNLRGHRQDRHQDAPQHGRAMPEETDGNGAPLADGHRILDAAVAQAWRPYRVGGLDIRA